MRPSRPILRTFFAAPVLLAMSSPALPADGPAGPIPQAPVSPSPQTIPSTTAYGPGALPPLPTAQSGGGTGSKSLPTIGDVASPYRSSGPAALAVPGSSTPNVGPGAGGPSYLDSAGSMGVASPYESTAAPGTSSPYGRPDSGGGAATSPYQAAAGGGPETGLFGGSGGALASRLGGAVGAAPSAFAMIGDMSPPVSYVKAAANSIIYRPPPPGARSKIAPSVRGFKIAENQSPIPQDRVFFTFNSFNNVNRSLNQFFEAPIKNVQIYRYTLGFEKTFNEGRGSVGLSLPIDNVYARSKVPALNSGGDSTALGDLSIFIKHIFAINPETGSVASGGVAVTPQTATTRFGGAQFLAPSNTTSIQPFFAFFINRDRLYLQGFSALDVPVDPSQPTLFYNDLGLGYYVYRDPTFRNFVTAVAPTIEVHVNSPINHSGPYNRLDANGTPDIVNITSGLNTRFRENSILTMGVVVPVTGPRPFSVEGTVLMNYYFGRSRRVAAPPIIGG